VFEHASKGTYFKSLTVLVLVLVLAAAFLPAFGGDAVAAEADLRSFLKSPQAVKGNGEHGLGFQLSPPGDYQKVDESTLAAEGITPGSSLGSSVDLSEQLPPVGNQGGQGSCVGWATSYYYKTWSEKLEHPAWDLSDPRYRFSPAFVYNQINRGVDNGAYFEDAFELLEAKGDVDISEMPYNQNNWTAQPTDAQFEAAKPYKIASGWSYFFLREQLGPYSPVNDISGIKARLDGGNMLVMGIPIYKDFPDYYLGPNPYYDYNGSSSLAGGHAVTVVGYDDNANPSGADADHRGGFKMVNSWGTGWNGSSAGFVYLSYDFVKRYVWEAWTMTDLASAGPAIDHLSTDTACPGQAIEISGNDFGANRRSAGVSFNGTCAIQASFTNSKVTVTVPAEATSGPVVVDDWEGTASNPVSLTVSASGEPAPTVTSINPSEGINTGTLSVSIEGAGFVQGCEVLLKKAGAVDLYAAGETVISAARVDCTVDLTGEPLGVWDVFVTNPDGRSGMLTRGFTLTNGLSDTYEPNDDIGSAYGPLQSGVAYTSFIGSADDLDYYEVDIPVGCQTLRAELESVPAGCDYDLYLYEEQGSEVGRSIKASNYDELIELRAPEAGTYFVLVVPWSGSSLDDSYSLTHTAVIPPPPSVSALSPASGKMGTRVAISGSDFVPSRGGAYVRFGSVLCAASDYVSWSDTRVVVKVPRSACGRAAVRVATGGGVSNALYFRVTPLISTISPTSGRKSELVTVNGYGFGSFSSGYTVVYFGGTRAISYAEWTNSRIVVRVPSVPRGRIPIKVKTAGGISWGKYFTVI
jgi:hypothetical protein